MAKFENITWNEKEYPSAITNYSLSMGEKLGLLEGSNLTDVLDSDSYLAVIYLSLIGPNKNLNISYEDFLGGITLSPKQILESYTNLIESSTEMKPNKFASGLEQSTSKILDKNQKKIKPPKVHVECVEDRYVWYCLIYGIESDIFWHFPIPDVERILANKQAFDAWKANPI